MPLNHQHASKVIFTCESCGREQGVRQMRKLSGCCAKCGDVTWRMEITFVERESPPPAVILAGAAFGALGALAAGWALGMPASKEREEPMHLVTPKIPAADALEIAGFGWGYKKAACRYMEMRQELDAKVERENQKAQGARHCLKCNYFFVPAAGKPWTLLGYCSQGCFGSANVAGEVSESLAAAPPPAEIKNSKTIAVVCKQGHSFEVATMYAGTFRPCPICNEKTAVK
jgi:hypothetical protein